MTMLDPRPFRPCAPDERPPRPRGIATPEGVGDRMRTAAFAELQAVHAFRWAADRYDDAPDGLREEWRAQVADEERHLAMILERMAALGVDPAERPVSLGLWRKLSACEDARSFCILIAEAEERGRRGGLALVDAVAERDPETAGVFREIAADEVGHVGLAERFYGWRPGFRAGASSDTCEVSMFGPIGRCRFNILLLLPLALLVDLAGSESRAGVLRVEKDGSGDFIQIQEAVEAAASGDTIRIGPGRWERKFLYTPPAGGWTDSVIVATDGKDLTVIGSGQEQTFIGPASGTPPYGAQGPIGVVVGTDTDLVLEGLTIGFLRNGLYFWGGGLVVRDVLFDRCYLGTSAYAVGGAVYDQCVFQCIEIGVFSTTRCTGLTVSECEFIGLTQSHISLRNTPNILIDKCNFYGGNVSVQFDGPSCHGIVRDCIVHSGYGPHIGAIGGCSMEINDNRLVGGNKQLWVGGLGTELFGTGNEFTGVDTLGPLTATIYSGSHPERVELHDGHILKGIGQFTVFNDDNLFPTILNLENNYWGTDDPEQIAEWILDSADEPELNVTVEYMPFHPEPVGEERRSVGNMKRMFR